MELGKLLHNSGVVADQPENPAVIRQYLDRISYDCVLVDRDAPPEWQDAIKTAPAQDNASPLIFITGPENSSPPPASEIRTVDGYLTRHADSTRLLTEHVRQAIGRIKASIVEKKTPIPSPISLKHPVPYQEHFANSRIIVSTGRITAPGPVEDIVSVMDRGKDRYAILLGDCTGSNGMRDLSYLLLRSRIEMHLAESPGPSQLLCDLNAELCSAGETVDFMTAVAVLVDMNRRRLTYSIAGHHPPLHRRWGGMTWRALPGNGIPLGIKRGETYQEHSRPLSPGDKVLLISDGFLKVRGAVGGLRDGMAALQEIDLLPSDAAPREVLEGIHDFVSTMAGGREISDEVTATLIQV